MQFKMMAVAIVFAMIAVYNQHYTAAVIVAATYLVLFYLNRLEIKINRLLDRYGIVVSEQELRD